MGDYRDLVLSTLERELIGNAAHTRRYNLFIDAIQKDVLFGTKKASSVDEVVSRVHTCLNSSKKRLEGLLLLHHIFQQCSTEIFVQHAKTWAHLLLSILQAHNIAMVHEMCSCVMGLLLEHASTFPEISREFSSTLLPSLITVLLESQPQLLNSALKCLRKCIIYFPGPCGNYTNKIETLVTPCLAGERTDFIQEAGSVYAMLGRCGGGGNLGTKYSESWTKYCDRLVGSIHDTLDKLYQDFETNPIEYAKEPSSIGFQTAETSEPQRSLTLVARMHALCHTLANMLTYDYPTAVKVPQRDVIALVCRTLALTPKQLMTRPTREKIILSSQMSSIHTDALSVLQALISCCKGHLIGHHRIINKCLMQSLSWSQSSDDLYGANRPSSSLRTVLYKTIEVWIQSLGASCGMDMCTSDICYHLLQDVTPQVDTVKNTTNQSTSKKLDGFETTGKRKKRSSIVSSGHLSVHRKLDATANSNVCYSALQALKSVLEKIGCFLKSNDQKKIQEVIVKTTMSIESESNVPPIPYGLPACRKALYEVLLATVAFPCGGWPPPTQCAVTIFSRGAHDCDEEVASFCKQALNVCEIIVHPKAPSFSMPASHPSAITMEDARKSLVSDEAMDRCDATPSKINVSNISFNDVWSVEGSLESKAAESNILINQDESGHEDKDDVQSNGSVTEMQHSDNSIEVLETADVPTDIDTQHNDKSESDNSRVEPLQNSEIPCDNKNISSVVENQNNGENNENAEEMDLSETATTNCKMLNNNTNHSEQTEDIDATVNLPVKRKLEDSDVTQQETMPKKAQIEEPSDDAMEDMMADFVDVEPDSE